MLVNGVVFHIQYSSLVCWENEEQCILELITSGITDVKNVKNVLKDLKNQLISFSTIWLVKIAIHTIFRAHDKQFWHY